MTTTDRSTDEMQTRSRARGLLSHRVVADVAGCRRRRFPFDVFLLSLAKPRFDQSVSHEPTTRDSLCPITRMVVR